MPERLELTRLRLCGLRLFGLPVAPISECLPYPCYNPSYGGEVVRSLDLFSVELWSAVFRKGNDFLKYPSTFKTARSGSCGRGICYLDLTFLDLQRTTCKLVLCRGAQGLGHA